MTGERGPLASVQRTCRNLMRLSLDLPLMSGIEVCRPAASPDLDAPTCLSSCWTARGDEGTGCAWGSDAGRRRYVFQKPFFAHRAGGAHRAWLRRIRPRLARRGPPRSYADIVMICGATTTR